jgi:AraC-like DNA-binding protein
MPKLVFSSADLPAGVDDGERFSLWRDMFVEMHGSFDLSRLADQRFKVRFDAGAFGDIALVRFEGTLGRMARTRQQALTSPQDVASFCINLTPAPMGCSQRGRELVVAPNTPVLMTNTDGGEVRANTPNAWYTVYLPHQRLRELTAHAEDMIAKPLDPANPAVRHLRRYLDILTGPDGFEVDPLLHGHVSRTLADLVALSLGVAGEVAEIAELRGVRAARLRMVIAEIQAGFARPEFSPDHVARRLGITPRYVQKLLYESGRGFTERVMELRLQKARAMLVSPHDDPLTITEIAYACGFNEASYFNRCFRRRFGASPTQYRGGGNGASI